MAEAITPSSSHAARLRLLLFVPSRRSPSETFIRANLSGLPGDVVAYFGDERPLKGEPLRLLYGLAILASKACHRLALALPASLAEAWERLGTWIPSQVAIRICRHERPDVVMAEFGFHAVRIMELVPATGLPLIVHFRGADASARRYLQGLSRRYARLLLLATAVVVKSQPMRRTVLELTAARPTPLPVLISPSGADAALFWGAQPSLAAPIFVAVGRFVAKKGPLQSLEAFARAAAAVPEPLRLVMVGDGQLLPAARRLAVRLGIEDRVTFAGGRSPAWIADCLRGARAFVQHSLPGPDGDQEGSPVSVMEAQLSGLPVVATRHAGIPEVVLDGKTGLLVEEGDVEAMARAIALLGSDPQLAARLGAAGRERCLEAFTTAHHHQQLGELISWCSAARTGRWQRAVAASNPIRHWFT